MWLVILLKTLVGWFILTYLSTNIVGFVVRGLVGEGVYVELKDERSAIRDIRKEFLIPPKLNFLLTFASLISSVVISWTGLDSSRSKRCFVRGSFLNIPFNLVLIASLFFCEDLRNLFGTKITGSPFLYGFSGNSW